MLRATIRWFEVNFWKNQKKTREDGNPFTPEIDELDRKIIKLTKEKEQSDELNKKVHLVYD